MRNRFCSQRYSILLQFALFVCSIALSSAAQTAEPRVVTSLLELRQKNVSMQQWDLSCGAAALATLLAYQHNDPIPEQLIARELIQRKEYIANPELVRWRQGFSLLDLRRFVESHNYRGIGYGQLTLQMLIDKAPIMVPVNFNGYNHFVIFRGVRGSRVLLADSAWGNRTLMKSQFEKVWIDYPTLGKVGFVVAKRDAEGMPKDAIATHALTPRASDFVMLE